MPDSTSTKQQLYDLCMEYVNKRIDSAQNMVTAAQTSANDETKSSAGDKFETGRAMMQQEAEWGRRQLDEARKLKADLELVKVETSDSPVHSGSLIYTNKGIFYISISAGKLLLNEESIYAISPASPIGSRLLGRGPGDKVELNGQTFQILKVE